MELTSPSTQIKSARVQEERFFCFCTHRVPIISRNPSHPYDCAIILMMLPVMNTAHAAAMDRFLPSLSDTVPAMSPPAAATKLSDETITPCDQTGNNGARERR